MDKSRVICVDIDGVIAGDALTAFHDYARAVLVPGAITALKQLKADGWHIHLYTGRHINHAETTQEWLRKHGVPYDVIAYGKPPAALYIDDRAVRVTKWSDMLEVVALLPKNPATQ